MNILLIGGGGREHAIAKAIKKSNVNLFTAMKNKNPGIAKVSKEILLCNETDIEKIVKFAKDKKIDLTVVGGEGPLKKGITDELEKQRIKVCSPRKNSAKIETSKEFMRNLMQEHNIKGLLKFGIFSSLPKAKEFISSLNSNAVIKPIGLTGGKGVKIIGEQLKDEEDAINYAKEFIEKDGKILIEEKLIGEEFTIQCFVDGKTVFPTMAIQDHKRAFENDLGHNTGGMGSYSQENFLLPFLNKQEYENAVEIAKQTISTMKKDGNEYKGILYGQFMLTKDGVKVIEFNARFGDPEAMNVLSLLEGDFLEIAFSIAEGNLKNNIKFKKKATVCKYAVPIGYGINPIANKEIFIEEKNISSEIYYGMVNQENGKIFTTTSRAIALVGIADDIYSAEKIVENDFKFVKGEIYHRKDIGKRESIEKKIKRMREILGR